MNPADFTDPATGALVRTPQGALAFVPAPLPPSLPLSWALVRHLSAADRQVSELRGVARTLPNPHLLIGSFVRREAVLSSRIEGTRADLSDLLLFEAGGRAEDPSDAREVANYVRALEHGLSRRQEIPLSLRLIREMHERLLTGVRGGRLTPGEFRRTQNWIGPPGSTLDTATFVPPPPAEMLASLDALEQYLHAPSELPPLVRLALVHYQFEAIHPFLDGNGRIGRLRLTLMLAEEGILPEPLLYLSAYFERRRADYYRLLLAVSQRGAWEEWGTFFLEGVAEQSGDALRRAHRLMELWQAYRQRLQEARASAAALRLLDRLFAYPAVTVAQAAEALGVTLRAAQQNVERLAAAGVLKEVTGRQRGRVWVAHDVIQVIEGEVRGIVPGSLETPD